MEILNNFSRIRLQRELGNTKRIYLENLYNGRVEGKYVFSTLNNNYPIEYYPSLLPIEGMFKKKVKERISMQIFEQFIFSSLKLFQFSKEGNIVNQRLSYFLFNAICSSDSQQKDKMFTFMLYFLQNSESFLSQVKLIDNDFHFAGKKVDMVEYTSQYFDFLIENKSELEDGDDFTIGELVTIKQFSNEFIQAIVNGIQLENEFFSFGTFRMKYQDNKNLFFSELSNYLDYYRLDDEDHADHNSSLYLNSKIERSTQHRSVRRPIKKKKMYAEYFIDSYILFFLRRETILNDLRFLSKQDSKCLENIIRSHSFVRMDDEKKRVLSFFEEHHK